LEILGSAQVILMACASGNFQLNVMLPLAADQLLRSLDLAARAARSLADRAIAGFEVREAHVSAQLAKNPILVTSLNPVIGYELGARLAKQAYAEGRPILDVAREHTKLSEAELRRLLDPRTLTRGGLVQAPSGERAVPGKATPRIKPRRSASRTRTR
jgi:fumarate hydratase class II